MLESVWNLLKFGILAAGFDTRTVRRGGPLVGLTEGN